MLRHVCREMRDPGGADAETGLPHVAHIAANAAILCGLYDDAKRKAEKGGAEMKMKYSIRQNGGCVEGVADWEEIDKLREAFVCGRARYVFRDDDGPQAVDLARAENVLCGPVGAENPVLGFREPEKPVPDKILFAYNGDPVTSLPPGLYFLSHPFTRIDKNQKTPEENRADSSRLAGILENRFPNIRIFDPINSKLGYTIAAPAEQNENQALEQCAGILQFCNGVLFAQGWQHSAGCNMERREALLHGIPRYFIGADV